jgi:hypothetical protein
LTVSSPDSRTLLGLVTDRLLFALDVRLACVAPPASCGPRVNGRDVLPLVIGDADALESPTKKRVVVALRINDCRSDRLLRLAATPASCGMPRIPRCWRLCKTVLPRSRVKGDSLSVVAEVMLCADVGVDVDDVDVEVVFAAVDEQVSKPYRIDALCSGSDRLRWRTGFAES